MLVHKLAQLVHKLLQTMLVLVVPPMLGQTLLHTVLLVQTMLLL